MNATPQRRPMPERPHIARTLAAEAAQEAPAGEETAPASQAAPAGAGRRDRPRMRSGRVSYAGRAASVYFATEEDRNRARAAFLARGGIEGYTSETAWWADLILDAVEERERAYNGGQPFNAPKRDRRHRRAT